MLMQQRLLHNQKAAAKWLPLSLHLTGKKA